MPDDPPKDPLVSVNVAVMVYGDPLRMRLVVAHVALPEDKLTFEQRTTGVDDPLGVSVNVTVPLGTPEAPPDATTSAVKVTLLPDLRGFREDDTLVVVGAWIT